MARKWKSKTFNDEGSAIKFAFKKQEQLGRRQVTLVYPCGLPYVFTVRWLPNR